MSEAELRQLLNGPLMEVYRHGLHVCLTSETSVSYYIEEIRTLITRLTPHSPLTDVIVQQFMWWCCNASWSVAGESEQFLALYGELRDHERRTNLPYPSLVVDDNESLRITADVQYTSLTAKPPAFRRHMQYLYDEHVRQLGCTHVQTSLFTMLWALTATNLEMFFDVSRLLPTLAKYHTDATLQNSITIGKMVAQIRESSKYDENRTYNYTDLCAHCTRYVAEPRHCAACYDAAGAEILYCDRTCQRAHWRDEHSHECAATLLRETPR